MTVEMTEAEAVEYVNVGCIEDVKIVLKEFSDLAILLKGHPLGDKADKAAKRIAVLLVQLKAEIG